MAANPQNADVTGAFYAVIRARRAVGFYVGLTDSPRVTSVRVVAIRLRGITTGRARGNRRMRASTGGAHVVRTLVAVVGTWGSIGGIGVRADALPVTDVVGALVAVVQADRARRLVVRLAEPAPVASIRVVAVRRAGIAARRTGGCRRIRAQIVHAPIVRAFLPVRWAVGVNRTIPQTVVAGDGFVDPVEGNQPRKTLRTGRVRRRRHLIGHRRRE